MSLSSGNMALVPYIPPKTAIEFLKLEFYKFQNRKLFKFIQTTPCQIGTVKNANVIVWDKKDCTIEKIRTCTFLRLYQMGLDEVPPPIRQLTRLKSIDLAGNQLRNIPEWIGELTDLRDLNLGRNLIKNLPNQIASLTNLNRINLYKNQLKAIPPQLFKIKNLQTLYVDDNQIQSISLDIRHLQNLKFFSIVQNGLVTIPKEIKELKSLTTLCCLYDNALDEPSIKIIKELGTVVKG